MNELLKIETTNNRITISARDLHDFLEVGTRFNDWFPRMTEYGLTEGEDFNLLKNERVQTEGSRSVVREVLDYQLTIDAAKEISMLQRNEKGQQARKYFIEVEKQWNSPERIMARALNIAQDTINALNTTLEIQKPKVDFFNQIASSKDAIEMSKVAKTLNIPGFGRNKLFDFLRNQGILQRDNIPYQRYCDSRHFRVIQTKYTTPQGEVKISFKTLVYPKGMNYIRKIVEKGLYQNGQ